MPGTALHIDDSQCTQHYRASLGASCCCLLWWYRHLFFQNDCSSPSGLPPFLLPISNLSFMLYPWGSLQNEDKTMLFSKKNFSSLLTETPMPFLACEALNVWALPTLLITQGATLPLLTQNTALLSVSATQHAFPTLGLLPVPRMTFLHPPCPAPWRLSEKPSLSPTPFKKFFSPHLESHHHVYFLLRT